jgi:hypothetical protein
MGTSLEHLKTSSQIAMENTKKTMADGANALEENAKHFLNGGDWTSMTIAIANMPLSALKLHQANLQQLTDLSVNINQTNWVWLRATGSWAIVGSSSSTNVDDRLLASGTELYMRSRNTGFSAVNMKPLTQTYQFLDGNSGVDFIPKLVEIANDSTLQNYGASAAFSVGETVVGSYNGQNLIRFRVATSNHKEGPFGPLFFL